LSADAGLRLVGLPNISAVRFTKYQPLRAIRVFGENDKEGSLAVSAGANLSVTDMRRAARHPVDFPVIVEHYTNGDLDLHVCNISAHGFMIDNAPTLQRGDRVMIRLPVVGRIEAYVIWIADERAGFQFERIVRLDTLLEILDQLQPNPRLRRSR
jgi:hypothetical protein